MTLLDCLDTLRGCGVTFKHQGGGLVLQSATFTPSPDQKAVLSAHKPLLLALLATDVAYPPEALYNAVEAYLERSAIMHGQADPETVGVVALAQARALLTAV